MKVAISLLILMIMSHKNVYSKNFDTNQGIFSGWVSKVNPKASLVRFKVDFNNLKYLNKKDVLQLWNIGTADKRCEGIVLGKTSEHILVKVTQFELCQRFVSFGDGAYMKFFSQDLVNNIKMGTELMAILTKKYLALSGKMKRFENELDGYLDRINTVNSRYEILKQKLEKEWNDELAYLEEDRVEILKEFQGVKSQLNDVKFKMEQYKIDDDNLKTDRWSLDSKQYYKK